ncbi:hypothetical protein [Amycolatopsis sp. CA-230715]|uniref:hypothetical protein n=1 Tax=Amycolatopsis sp. CA-230715 TaxID=2745196 RepID=UPI001C02CF76|nr:hypothetical protein [Amycolatopsis sp. CA-230715]QWF79302.1 hypothetical protein HUW46_02709 [Amycolatopsis sp. CA-230715]
MTVAPRYFPLPQEPVVESTAVLGKVVIAVALSLHGALLVTGEPGGDVLAAATEGVFVRGIDSAAPAITAAAGHRFVQTRRLFRPPSAMVFEGSCHVAFALGGAGITGKPSYLLEVGAAWTGRETSPPRSAVQWEEFFGSALSAVGAIVLSQE